MNFSTNSALLYIVAACVIVFVLAQSVFFLVRAYRRGKELGMDAKKLKKNYDAKIFFAEKSSIDISSTVLRDMIEAGDAFSASPSSFRVDS